ncbi:MAG: GMP synthase (glutamine-hydrolyzing), partial [Actinobacteria bacterium]|nr:GMP synthase (glutamine-hydrolyzing) [Actinomycetota bacterium]
MQSNNHVLVIDFGAQYAQLIARRVRQAGVYSEIISHKSSLEEILTRNPRAIILSGGPSSVYVDDSPLIDRALFEQNIPIFGI